MAAASSGSTEVTPPNCYHLNYGDNRNGTRADGTAPRQAVFDGVVEAIFTDFVEVHGDRRYADDPAMIAGFARLDGSEVCVIGQQKGRDINERRHRNFAMSKPEGYRKALRVMQLAENSPVPSSR